MSNYPKPETFQSPYGEAVFPWLNTPDVKHDPNGVYHTDLAIPPELCEEFVAKLNRIRDEWLATIPLAKQGMLKPWPVHLQEMTRPKYEAGMTDAEKADIKHNFIPEPTGNLLFRFKLKAHVTPRTGEPFDQKPIVVHAETGEKVEETVYNGSVIRIRGQVVPYTNYSDNTYGLSLRMKAVQVLELVTGGDAGTQWTDFSDE